MMDELQAFAYETLAVASGTGATSLTRTVYQPAGAGLPARAAHVVVDTVSTINYTFGGVTAGTATGHFATPTQVIKLEGNNQIRDFRLIAATSGTAAQVSVTYFR
jgi:hypothetical protein